MALAMLSKKKLKSRPRQRSPSSRAFEELDEDMAIVSRLENEPWQPDLLLERQSDKVTADPSQLLRTASSTASSVAVPGMGSNITTTTSTTSTINSNGLHGQEMPFDSVLEGEGKTTTTAGGFQGVIPVIIKSPSSVITTTTTTTTDADADSDCTESIVGEGDQDGCRIPLRVEEYLQQSRQEQELLQQRQQQVMMPMQMEFLPPQLQYQVPAHLQSTNTSKNDSNNDSTVSGDGSNNNGELEHVDVSVKRRQPKLHEQLQYTSQFRNSFHGQTSAVPFLGLDDQSQAMAGLYQQLQSRPLSTYESHSMSKSRSESPTENIVSDNEDVIESLQSLKNITMLALNGLLQQVVSDVTARDPVHNPDETTIEARALIRRRSIPLLDFVAGGNSLKSSHTHQDQDQDQTRRAVSDHVQHEEHVRRSISGSPVALLATSSLERLDELSRKVDQLATAAAFSSDELSSEISSSKTREALPPQPQIQPRQPQRQEQSHLNQQQQSRLDPCKVFESEEYQLACALAAMLACIYRILDRMQQEPRATPLRTESADSGLDQAAKLWKRLASNSFTKNPHLRPSSTTAATSRDAHTSDAWTASLPSLSEKKASGTEISATATINGGTTSFMQSINKQVKTLKSRRTQSTSQIEVASPHQVHKSLQGRVLGGLKFGSSHRSKGNGTMPPETPAQVQNAKELEREWAELDSLMEEMAHLWRFVKSLDDNDEEQDSDDAEDRARGLDLLREESAEDAQMLDPFHDRNQILPSHAALSAATATATATATTTTTTTATAREFDRLTLDMAGMGEDLPQYYEAIPQYNLLEKSGAAATTTDSHQDRNNSLTRRTNRGGALAPAAGLDDEKTRFDLHNVMSAIERLSQVAPRMDNQRVQLSPSQKRQMARASVSRTIERLSTSASASASASSSSHAAQQQQLAAERTRDLSKLMNQIVESANKASFVAQRAEFSQRQQWKLEEARVGAGIERGERLRMSGQDWQAPEKVLLKDMTRLTNALYQQSASASSQAFQTQRYTLTEGKARSMALQGIIGKIERVSGRRMENQDALPPAVPTSSSSKVRTTSISLPMSRSARTDTNSGLDGDEGADRAKGLQEILNEVVESGGGPTRKLAIASQRAQFVSK